VSVDDPQQGYYHRNFLQARRVLFDAERDYYSMNSQ